MAAPFAFLPRAVSKHTKEWQGISRPPPSPSPPPDPTGDSENEDEDGPSSTALDKVDGKGKVVEPAHSRQSAIAQDVASLVSLALSEYNIWRDADLRWKLDACLRDESSPDEGGFVPINYLLRRAPFRGSLQLAGGQPEPSETEVVKALRTHASHVLEVRMRLPFSTSSATSSSVWYGTGKTSRKKDVGGYEVRRRDWLMLHDRSSHGWSRARWDDVTVYIECIPPLYRTFGSIARFAETLLPPLPEPETDTGAPPCLRVQNVSLLPHHLDKPEDTPKCKGYALITFSTKSQAEAVLRAWPWKRRHVPDPPNEDERMPFAVKESHKYGLRAISKARWNALNEEYLLYKQRLLDEMARTQTEMHHPSEDASVNATDHERGEPIAPPKPDPQTQTRTTSSSPYPFDCLVFARNVHPETNKTTLKSLFAQAFQDGSGLDYIDFSKGMDTCYLRLASPRDTSSLIEFFNSDAQRKVQTHGLDATGRTPVQGDKPITMERIQGRKEELYWEKVPEKIRRQVVGAVVSAQLAADADVESKREKERTREP